MLCGREVFEGDLKIVRGQSQLFEVVGALHPPRRFTSGLYGWQQQPNHHADNGDYDQQLHQRETRTN
jgi:hypothetical protein